MKVHNMAAKAFILSNRAVLKIYLDWNSLVEGMGSQWISYGYVPLWATKVDTTTMDKFLYNLNS